MLKEKFAGLRGLDDSIKPLLLEMTSEVQALLPHPVRVQVHFDNDPDERMVARTTLVIGGVKYCKITYNLAFASLLYDRMPTIVAHEMVHVMQYLILGQEAPQHDQEFKELHSKLLGEFYAKHV